MNDTALTITVTKDARRVPAPQPEVTRKENFEIRAFDNSDNLVTTRYADTLVKAEKHFIALRQMSGIPYAGLIIEMTTGECHHNIPFGEQVEF